MKPALFAIPFLALFVGMIGTAVGSAFPDLKMASTIAWIVAAGLVVLWIGMDQTAFKRFLARKGTKFGASSGAVVLVAIAAIVGAGFLSNRPRFNKSFDLTKTGQNTLSDQSLKVVEAIEKRGQDVSVTAFFQDDAVKDEFKNLAALYLALDAKLKIEYVDTQSDPTRAMGEKLTAGNTVIFRLGSQETRITTFNEEKMTNALVSVLKEKTKKVYFTKGHGEGVVKGGEQNGYDFVVQHLENNKYQVEQVSLLDQARVPDDADLLVIAGPEYDFKPEEAAFVEAYLKKGGAVLAMVDAVRSVPTINGVMEKFGIKFNSDLVIMGSDDPRALLLGRNNAIVSEFDDFNPVTKDFARQSQVDLIMPFTRTVAELTENANGMKVVLAGKTSESMEKVSGVESESDLRNIDPARLGKGSFPVVAVATGKAHGPNVADTGSPAKTGEKAHDEAATKSDTATTEGMAPADKEIRLVAVGSSHFVRNDGAQSSASNRDLFVNISNYLLQDEDFISIRPKDVSKSTITLTSAGSQLVLSMLSLIYPFFFLGGGVLFWLKRRNA